MKKSAPYVFLLLGITQAIHSIEEYSTRLFDYMPGVTSRIHDSFEFFPVLSMSEQTFAALNIGIVVLILSISPFVFLRKRWALIAAIIIAVVEFFNGLGHVSAAIYTWEYFPGCLSSIGLVILSLLYLRCSYTSKTITKNEDTT